MEPCRYETIEEITEEDFHGAFQRLLKRYKCIAAGEDYFEGDYSFICVLSIKVPIRKKPENLSYAPRMYKEDLALNNLQRLVFPEPHPAKKNPEPSINLQKFCSISRMMSSGKSDMFTQLNEFLQRLYSSTILLKQEEAIDKWQKTQVKINIFFTHRWKMWYI